jgi:hypothetical protein
MTSQSNWRNHFQEHKTLFTVIIVGLLFFELQILALAVFQSGRQSRLQIINQRNQVVYETRSHNFESWEKIQFEKNFGPLADYSVRQITVERPFPFRSWFAGAVGLPIGAMLLFAFFIRAYEALFFRNEGDRSQTPDSPDGGGDKVGLFITRVSRLNIFALGGAVLVIVLGLFAVPHMIAEFGSYGVSIISEYRWVVLGGLAIALSLVVWIIYLRYQLARKAMETRAELEKYRMQLQFHNMQGSIPHDLEPGRQLKLPEQTSFKPHDDDRPHE